MTFGAGVDATEVLFLSTVAKMHSEPTTRNLLAAALLPPELAELPFTPSGLISLLGSCDVGKMFAIVDKFEA